MVLGDNRAKRQFRGQNDRPKTDVSAKIVGIVLPGTLAVFCAALCGSNRRENAFRHEGDNAHRCVVQQLALQWRATRKTAHTA